MAAKNISRMGTRTKIVLLSSGLLAAGLTFLPLDHLKFWTFDYVSFLFVILAVPPVLVLNENRWIRSLVILFSLAYFGFLQAACPRLPGAMELILLNLANQNPIWMHIIKVSVVLASALVYGRYYCGWICPKGVIQEYVYQPRLGFKPPPKLDKVLKYGKYVTLAGLVGSPVLFQFKLFREIGPFKVIFNLDGSTWLIVFLGIVLAASVFIERAYCRYFCPEGGLLALLSILSPFKIRVNKGTCTGCTMCAKVCPTDAIQARKKETAVVRSSECIFCMECLHACRQGSIVYGLPWDSSSRQAGTKAPANAENGGTK